MIFINEICVHSAACMSWELAESGKKFITSVVNATDLVPTFSAVSVDNLRSEVMLVSVHWNFYISNTLKLITFIMCTSCIFREIFKGNELEFFKIVPRVFKTTSH